MYKNKIKFIIEQAISDIDNFAPVTAQQKLRQALDYLSSLDECCRCIDEEYKIYD